MPYGVLPEPDQQLGMEKTSSRLERCSCVSQARTIAGTGCWPGRTRTRCNKRLKLDDLHIALYSDDSGKNVQQPRPAPVQGRKQPNALATVRPSASVNYFQRIFFSKFALPKATMMVRWPWNTIVYHGLPWYSMVIQSWSTMVDHVLLNGRLWLTMV